ncbi:MAG: hypothetical protein ACHREM_16255, partial [Polyangiales bacterium]
PDQTDGLIVQVKKLNDQRRTANAKTMEAKRFDSQLVLQGLPIAPRITVGYLFNRDATDFTVEAVYRRGNRKAEWSFEVDAERVSEQILLFQAPPKEERLSRVSAKTGVTLPETKPGTGETG